MLNHQLFLLSLFFILLQDTSSLSQINNPFSTNSKLKITDSIGVNDTTKYKLKQAYYEKNGYVINYESMIVSKIDTITYSEYYLYLSTEYKPSKVRFATNSNQKSIRNVSYENILIQVDSIIENCSDTVQKKFCIKMRNQALIDRNQNSIYSISCEMTYLNARKDRRLIQEVFFDGNLNLLSIRNKKSEPTN